ncbi:MAG TPA: TonB-dependent receptor [Thermoanaerobaculia bacterium]
MKLNRFLAVLAAAVLLLGIPAFAQTTSNLTGTVTMGGNPLPGATVTISSPNMIGSRTAVTDANGNYNFGAIPPGDYTVKFEMESMQSVTKTVRVGLAQTGRADAQMKLTSVAEAITVTASAPAVLETTEVQTNISAKLINDLPIGRTLTATVSLAPGVTASGPNGNQVISGAPSYDNLYMIDGATVNENLRGQPHDLFIEDAIQETTVLTGAISAEFGRFTGGVVTAVSKSGGNEFSGTFRDSFQSPKWTSLSKGDTSRRTNNINQTDEATLGGRIIRDRLWFFTAGRYFKQNNPQNFKLGDNSTGIIPQTFTNGRKQRRLEGKLTGQITPKHSITGSVLDIKDDQTNNFFASYPAMEATNIDTARSTPNSFRTLNYNGVITNSFLIEGLWAKKKFTFVGSGGDARFPDDERRTFIEGSSGLFNHGATAVGGFGAPLFCGVCTNEGRDNKNWQVKGTYYLSTKGFGTHNIVAGYDNWMSTRRSDNHQSASDFTIGLYAAGQIQTNPDGKSINISAAADGNTLIIWWPILQSTKGTDLTTDSVFVNDKWDFSNKLSFNLGARYDKNQGKDGAHQKIADDSKTSPRLGVTYDLFGNGRIRLNGSYSEYVTSISDGNVADAASPAGSPSYLYWYYGGPDMNHVTSTQFFTQLYDWFKSVGYTSNKDFLAGGKTNGLASRIPFALKSPYVGEFTIGAGTQIGSHGFLRADYIDRKWKNFYVNETSIATGQIFDPLLNGNADITNLITSNDLERKYRAVQLQGSYQLFSRLNLGGNYTYSRLRGNHVGETGGSGPVPTAGPNSYPEYLNYPNRNPIGTLSSDQTHKARGWVSYDQPTHIGNFNFSLLERFDSGLPYSAVGSIDPRRRQCNAAEVSLGECTAANLGKRVTLKNPGYNFPPTSANYYFSKRGGFRFDDLTATDVAVNWNSPSLGGKALIFVEAELRNAFNEQASVSGDTTVFTNRSSGNLLAFNPFTETPVECPNVAANYTSGAPNANCLALGANFMKGPNFGKGRAGVPTTFTQAGDWQLPRTFLISAGVRF